MEHKKVSKKVKGNSNERRKEQEERSGEVKLELSNLAISDSEPVTEERMECTKSLQKLGRSSKAGKSARGKGGKLVQGEEKVQGGGALQQGSVPEVD